MRKLITICTLAVLILAVTPAAKADLWGMGWGGIAPPGSLGPYTMTPFGPDPQAAGYTAVSSVASPLGGTVGFSPSLLHALTPSEWATWSHGYTGDVYYQPATDPMLGDYRVTLAMPAQTLAFYLYAEPDPFHIGGSSAAEKIVEGFVPRRDVPPLDQRVGDVGPAYRRPGRMAVHIVDRYPVPEAIELLYDPDVAIVAAFTEGLETRLQWAIARFEKVDEHVHVDAVVIHGELDARDEPETEPVSFVAGLFDSVERVMVGQGDVGEICFCSELHHPVGCVRTIG